MSKRPLLLHRERAEGVDKRLLDFLDWWAQRGPFPLVVDPKGGVRYDERLQLELFRKGASKAQHLEDTPHGRGGAIDCHPCILGAAGQVIALRDKDLEAYATYGELGKARGLLWGGDWKRLVDCPHLEVPAWRNLPMPTSAKAAFNKEPPDASQLKKGGKK